MDDFDIHHAMFDEHPFRFGDAEEQLVKILLVVRSQRCLLAVFERDGFWKFLKFKLDAE
jgi:hypothetical protein